MGQCISLNQSFLGIKDKFVLKFGKNDSIFIFFLYLKSKRNALQMISPVTKDSTEIGSTTSLKLEELNTDILSQIFNEVTIQNRDEIAIFKAKYEKFIQSKGYGAVDFTNESILIDDKADEVHSWIVDYVHDLSQNQVNAILVVYGINKALKLMYDFHKIGMGDDDAEFCEELTVNPADRDMVDLIFKDEVKFMSNWKENKNM
jgi:hypothetical protein